jgi:hypothetical protein
MTPEGDTRKKRGGGPFAHMVLRQQGQGKVVGLDSVRQEVEGAEERLSEERGTVSQEASLFLE